MRWFFGVFLFAVALTGCKYQEGYEKFDVPGKFSIEVPHYMSKSDKLHPDAVFQYENQFRTTYILVLEEKAADYDNQLQAYNDFAVTDLTKRLADVKQHQVDSVSTINGHAAMVTELEGGLTGERVYYKIGVIDAGQNYYRILGWTVLKYDTRGAETNLRPSVLGYIADIDHMIHSFKPAN